MNLVRFNHPGFANFFDTVEKTHNGLTNESSCNEPSVNIIENDKNFVIEFAVPGVKKEDFNINLEDRVLTVSREAKEEETNKENYTRREFVYGSFSRSFTLPKSIKYDDITAKYNEGILVLSLPKKEEEAKLSRVINIP